MAFRRQDIPKTTRKGDEGAPRRLYPRYLRDRALLPKIELAIGYLDGMVGRARGDLSPDVVLDLFGDPKLARCILTCLAQSYRYRTPSFAEVVGEEAALSLAGWDILTPADLRGHIYRAANAERGGFVAETERAAFLADRARPLGLTADQLDRLLHLDAERNAVLVRVGPRPAAADVLARYNALLTLSVLRQASEVTLELPGLSASTIETVCSRNEVPWRRVGEAGVRLAGRRTATGSWASFGARLARCAAQLIMLCPQTPSGAATVHLSDRPLAFALDAKAVGPLRPAQRAVADGAGVIAAAVLVESVTALRRQASGEASGWTLRRQPEPIVVEGSVVLPELLLTRGETAVAIVPVPDGRARGAALAALDSVQGTQPVIALGAAAGATAAPALPTPDAHHLFALAEEQARDLELGAMPLDVVAEELASADWVPTTRLHDLTGETTDLARSLQPLTEDGDAILVPGCGLCRLALVDELLDRLSAGPLEVAAFRGLVAARVGDGAHADALTLHLLGRQRVVADRRPESPPATLADRAA